LAQERVVNRTVDGGVQQDVHTKREVAAAAPGLTLSHQQVLGAGPEIKGRSPGGVSHQVVVGDIPEEPSGFRPRADLLAELDRAGARVSVIHPVIGLHGLGATQLAAAYARAKLAAGWRLVAWVNGSDISSLQAGLAEVAHVTGLIDGASGRDVADAGAEVRHRLETDGDRCLLVFDGVPDPEVLRPFVPATGAARVLITGTWPQAADLGNSIPVEVFSAEDASAFLAQCTGSDDEAGAAAVAAALGCMPLALSLAAPLIAGPDLGYWLYLDRLQATPADVYLTGADGEPYPPFVARAVLFSLHAVRVADQTGVSTRVLELIAVLSAAGVRRELLHAAGQAGVLANGGRRVASDQVDRVLDGLCERSLVTVSTDGQTVILPCLVSQVIGNGLARRQMFTAACEAAAFVLDVHSQALVGSPDRRAVREIPQQVTALLTSLAGPAADADEELAWVLLRLRFIALYHLLELGDSTPQAVAVGEPLAADLERLLGPDHPDTLNSWNSLAAAYLAAGRVAEAIPLFERTLAMRQRMLGPDDPETLTSQNNLASAYQDAGRIADAIQLYELNLEVRERLLGADHPSTLNSRGNLAAAYRDEGRAAEAIPLLEQALAGRERVLGPHHPDTEAARNNLAAAYRDEGRAAEAIPLLEQALAGRERVLDPHHPDAEAARNNLAAADPHGVRGARLIPPAEQTSAARKGRPRDGATGQTVPDSLRRPPADPARRMLPVGLRRPPADTARQSLRDGVASPSAKLTGHVPGRTQDPAEDASYDREVVAAIAAGDPAGVAMAYDRYAAALYGYCHWMLHHSADAAGALTDTFVIAAATCRNLSEPAKLRPWLFALARNENRRRIRPTSAARDEEVDAEGQPPGAVGEPSHETMTSREGLSPGAVRGPSDETMTFRAVGQPPGAVRGPSDETMTFRAVGQPPGAVRGPSDETITFRMVMPTLDATMPFRVVGESAHGPAQVHGDQGHAELRSLIDSILVGLKPREREVIELTFRHDLSEDDLAIALGVSKSRARALAARARRRLEEALRAMHIALTGREACPALGTLLANWDGQLTEETRDLVVWHIEECQTCTHRGWGAQRPAAFSRLLPLAPLPPELRTQVLSLCTSTVQDAVAYRRRVARRAERVWFARLSTATRQVSWAGVRANPGIAIAAAAIAVWVMTALIGTLLTFGGSRAAHAQVAPPSGAPTAPTRAAQSSVGIPAGGPAGAPTTAAPTFATTTPSPAVTQAPAYVPPTPVQSSPPPEASRSPSPSSSPSASSSPSPSRSPSPSSSPSPSPSPSRSSSPSPTA
jgi:RNA polymerase sigma factor (sigma-70 family)